MRRSPWSAGEKAFLLCFSEWARFLCPDRNAWVKKRRRDNRNRKRVSAGLTLLNGNVIFLLKCIFIKEAVSQAVVGVISCGEEAMAVRKCAQEWEHCPFWRENELKPTIPFTRSRHDHDSGNTKRQTFTRLKKKKKKRCSSTSGQSVPCTRSLTCTLTHMHLRWSDPLHPPRRWSQAAAWSPYRRAASAWHAGEGAGGVVQGKRSRVQERMQTQTEGSHAGGNATCNTCHAVFPHPTSFGFLNS